MSKKLLEIPKSQAIAIVTEAMGYKTAKKMTCDQLTEKINAIEEAPDEPLSTEELDELIEKLMDVEEAVVVDEDEEEEEDEDNTDDETEDDAEEEEEVKPKKDKKKKGKSAKSTKTKKKEPVEKKKKESLDSVTLELIKAKPMKIESLVKALLKKFPDSDEETLTRTTKRRVTGHLQGKYDVTIKKSKKGAYSVE